MHRIAIGVLVVLLRFPASADAQPAAPTNVGAGAAQITLTWNANTEADLQGYKVYWGASSRKYGAPTVLGKETVHTVTGLETGTYFFAVTAFNPSGESAYSNEATITIPAASPIASLMASVITASSATISWVTRQECSGKVDFGATSTFSATVVANNLGTTDHLAVLSGLIGRTHYFYRVTGVCGGVAIQSETRTFNTK